MASHKFIDYLEQLIASTRQKIFLIIDRHPTHMAKAVERWVSEHAEEIEIAWLPRYSPEYNPDEFLNNDLKANLKTSRFPKTPRISSALSKQSSTRSPGCRSGSKGTFDKPNLNYRLFYNKSLYIHVLVIIISEFPHENRSPISTAWNRTVDLIRLAEFISVLMLADLWRYFSLFEYLTLTIARGTPMIRSPS